MQHTVEKENLWRDISRIQLYIVGAMLRNHDNYTGKKSRDLVNRALLSLMQQPTEFREKQNVAEYIQDRTMLSRSLIMNILGSLRHNKNIEIKKGILKHIDDLPQ